jgi:hypothetical protein
MVTRTVDGDRLFVQHNGKPETVRLIANCNHLLAEKAQLDAYALQGFMGEYTLGEEVYLTSLIWDCMLLGATATSVLLPFMTDAALLIPANIGRTIREQGRET